jgi:hypothetical protein
MTSSAMTRGMDAIFHSSCAQAVRAFLRDKLGFTVQRRQPRYPKWGGDRMITTKSR